jgi:hypothetical protein
MQNLKSQPSNRRCLDHEQPPCQTLKKVFQKQIHVTLINQPTNQPNMQNPNHQTHQPNMQNPNHQTHQPNMQNPNYQTHQPNMQNPNHLNHYQRTKYAKS